MAKKEYDKLIIDDGVYETRLTRKYRKRKPWQKQDPGKVLAVIPGTIVAVRVKKGQRVRRGESLLVLEAMKMKNEIFAPIDGRVKELHVTEGQVVPRLHLLAELEP